MLKQTTCLNDKCKFYYERLCLVERNTIGKDGKCKSFIQGTCEGYLYEEENKDTP